MDKIKAVVLHVNGKRMCVVTETGDFLDLPLRARIPRPGEQIEIDPHPKPILKPYFMVAAVLVIFTLMTIFNPLSFPQAVASVALDFTPSLDLMVNKHNKVISVNPWNEEAKVLLQDVNVKDLDIYEAVGALTTRAAELGYLEEAEENFIFAGVIDLKPRSAKACAVDKEQIRTVIHSRLNKGKYEGFIVVNDLQNELREEAIKEGLSVNKYLLKQKSQEYGINLDKAVLQNNPVSTVIEESKVDVPNAFPGSWCQFNSRKWDDNNPPEQKQIAPEPKHEIYNEPVQEDYRRWEEVCSPTNRGMGRWND